MISASALTNSILGALFVASVVRAGDLSRYREFQLGMSISTVVKQAQTKLSEVKVIHQRPAMIQNLEWFPGRSRSSPPNSESVDKILFSFYNGVLFQMAVTYELKKTMGLTVEDMIEAITADYGPAQRPDEEMVFPSIYNDSLKVSARWEDSHHSFTLVRFDHQSGFGAISYSKSLHAQAKQARSEAIRLDKQEGPQREIDRNRKLDEENRVERQKARVTNKAIFRP